MSENRIFRTTRLSSDVLNRLISDEISVLIVEDYYPHGHALRLSDEILASQKIERYTHEVIEEGELVQKYFGVDRMGLPFNSTYGLRSGHPLLERYYKEARQSIDRLRVMSAPMVTPIDKLRLELDEYFAPGATVASFQDRKMLAGIARITKADLSHLSADQPHFDALPEGIAKLDQQFAANIYLKVPDTGGELEVWDVKPVDPLSATPCDWRGELPRSQLVKPKVGDLILFNCRRPHAVAAFKGEDRVTVQMFIGYKNGQPLQMWN
jgi:hypothetical protein